MFELRWVECEHIFHDYGGNQVVGKLEKKLQYRATKLGFRTVAGCEGGIVSVNEWSEWFDVPTVRDDLT